jgi:hypothetical protein
MHMLAAIHEHCTLGRLSRQDLEYWRKAKEDADTSMKTCLGLELDKEAIVSLLAQPRIRYLHMGWSAIIDNTKFSLSISNEITNLFFILGKARGVQHQSTYSVNCT